MFHDKGMQWALRAHRKGIYPRPVEGIEEGKGSRKGCQDMKLGSLKEQVGVM